MKYSNNLFFMLLTLAFGLSDALTLRAEGEYEEAPTQETIQPSRSIWDRLYDSKERARNRINEYLNKKDSNEKSSGIRRRALNNEDENSNNIEMSDKLPSLSFGENLRNENERSAVSGAESDSDGSQATPEAPVQSLEDRLETMTPEEVSLLSPKEIQDLDYEINKLTKKQIASLTKEQIQSMAPHNILMFDKGQIESFKFSDLTVSQIKQLVGLNGTGNLRNITNNQFDQLTPDQINAFLEAKEGTFSPKQLDILNLRETSLYLQSRTKDGRFGSLIKNPSLKNFNNIFKSDKAVLKEFISKAAKTDSAQEILESKTARNAIDKLSRTEKMDLFTKVTQERSQERNENTQEIFQRYAELFKPLMPKNQILIPVHDTLKTASSYKFEILDMTNYDPRLTIEQNAKNMKVSQNLSLQVTDPNSKASGDDASLSGVIRNYLENNPSVRNLKALLVDNADSSRKLTSADQKTKFGEIMAKPNMETLFSELSGKDLTDISNVGLKLDKNLSLNQARAIFYNNAELYQSVTPDALIVPTESSGKNDLNSFKFEKIDLSNIKSELSEIDFSMLTKDTSTDTSGLNFTKADLEIAKLALKLKTEQKLSLSIQEIEKLLKNYIKAKPDFNNLFGPKNSQPILNQLFPSSAPTHEELFPSFARQESGIKI